MSVIPGDLMSRLRFLAQAKTPIMMVPTSDGDVQRPALAVAVECIDGLETRVAELEAAQKPRPMSEAPRNGTTLSMFEQNFTELSACGKFRYTLRRCWDSRLPRLVWMMLNPSTADADDDDPTIRRVRRFTQREGYGSFTVVNVFAWRATSPLDLHRDRPGRDDANQAVLERELAGADVIVAWGNNIAECPCFTRAKLALREARRVRCLGLTLGRRGANASRLHRQPRHPVRLANDTPLIPWCGWIPLPARPDQSEGGE